MYPYREHATEGLENRRLYGGKSREKGFVDGPLCPE